MQDTIPHPAIPAELAARRAAAAAALADFRAFESGASVQADWAVWAGRLAAAVRSLLEMTGTVLDPVQLATLGLALADAAEYRQPAGLCADCDVHPAGLCAPHAADLDRADDYAALARQLGVEVDPC